MAVQCTELAETLANARVNKQEELDVLTHHLIGVIDTCWVKS